MPQRLLILLVLAIGVTAGCASAPQAAPARPATPPSGGEILPPPPFEDTCGAMGYKGLVGRPVAAVTLPDTLRTRVIKPGDAVTKDYRPARMNIDLDDEGVIVRLWCG